MKVHWHLGESLKMTACGIKAYSINNSDTEFNKVSGERIECTDKEPEKVDCGSCRRVMRLPRKKK